MRIGQVGGRPEGIAVAEVAIRGIDVQIKVFRGSLSDATLLAPFDRIVARRTVENFTNVQAGQSIVVLQGLNVVLNRAGFAGGSNS